MTTLSLALSRPAARAFQPGDEILVSCLDHDAGVAPWLEIAHDRDLVVRHVGLHDDTTLDFADLESKLGPRTKVVAFAWASNAVGTVTDAKRVGQLAHDRGPRATRAGCPTARGPRPRSLGGPGSTTPRRSRSTSAPSAPTCSSARRTSSA